MKSLKKKGYKKKQSSKTLIMKWTDYAGQILTWSVLFALFCVLPLYMKTSYEQIATNKYLCYMMMSRYLIYAISVFAILWILLSALAGRSLKLNQKPLLTDACIGLLLLANLISVLKSEFRFVRDVELNEWYYEGTLWGTKGWYMGFMTMLIAYIFYFFISHNLKYTKGAFFFPFLTVTFVSLFGVVNRLGWHPLATKYGYDGNSYLSTLGNMNWLSAYTSVLLPLIFGYTWGMPKKKIRSLFMVMSVIGFLMILLNGSDSGILGLAAMFAVLLVVSVSDYDKLLRFFELCVMLAGSMVFVWIIDLLFPTLRTKPLGISEKFFSPIGLLICVIFVFIYLTLRQEEIRLFLSAHLVKKPIWVGVFFAGILFVYAILVVINTKTNRALFSNGFMYFDASWGSMRGATWSLGMKTFGKMDVFHKLFGTGPDGFYFELSKYPDLLALSEQSFGNSRLTNAHNEIISLLVNDGIVGALGFLGLMAATAYASVKMSLKKREYIGFLLMVTFTLFNDFFSFRTISSTPLLFLAIALLAAFQRAEFVDKQKV